MITKFLGLQNEHLAQVKIYPWNKNNGLHFKIKNKEWEYLNRTVNYFKTDLS